MGLTAIFVTHDQDEAMVMSDVIHLFHEGKIEQSGSPVSVYTRPVSTFAAGFIGSYNILKPDEFEKVTGVGDLNREVAIRPETISISKTKSEVSDEIAFEGIIKDNVPRGNVLRYTVETNGIEYHVDVLFRSKVLFDNGEKVYMSVAKHNCIEL